MAKKSQPQEADFPFPLEGIDITRSFTRQRSNTTIDAQNVRAFDPVTNRARGAKRSGTVKYFPGLAVQTTGPGDATSDVIHPIQDINHLVSTELTPPTVFGRFAYAQASGSGFGIADGDSGASVYSGLGAVSGFQLANSCWDEESNAYVAMVNQTTGAINIYCISSSGAVVWTQSTLTCATGSQRNVPGMVIIGDYLYVAITTNTTYLVANAPCRIAKIAKSTGSVESPWRLCSTAWYVFFSEFSINCLGAIGDILYVEGRNAAACFVLSIDTTKTDIYTGIYVYPSTITPNASKVKICTDGVGFIYVIGSRLTSQIMKLSKGLQLVWASTAADPPNSICYDKKSNLLLAAAASAPSIRSLNLETGAIAQSAVTSSIFWDEIDSDSQGTFTLWKSSQASNDVMALSSTLGTNWGPLTLANALHVGSSVNKGTAIASVIGGARQIRPYLVAGGQFRIFDEDGATAVTGGQSFDATAPQIFSAQNGLNAFFADGSGYFYYKANENQVIPWVATAPGEIPTDSPVATCARLIETWRGRTVLMGFVQNPQMWYMSRQFDPFDWIYDAEIADVAAAVNGNTSKAGLVGDLITCMIPYTDDSLLVGCDHSIWLLRGDPRVGGQFDNISDSIGVLFGRPWARSAEGEQVYFMSNTGSVYKITPGSMPIRVSQQIDRMLEDVDLSTVRVMMAWDIQMRGLCVYVTPLDVTQPTTNYFYEERTNAWWKDVFKDKRHNPMAVHVFDGDLPEDRRIMLGGRDGYLRILSNDATTDSGKDIEAHVWLGPLATRQMEDICLDWLQPILGKDSGNVNFAVHAGETAEEAYASEAVVSGVWRAGRNIVSPVNRSGFAIYVKVSSTNYFAIEKIRMQYRTLGKIRSIL